MILASKSGVRKKILDDNNIDCEVIVSNVDEDEVKASLISEGADPLVISKNLAEIKSIKVSNKNQILNFPPAQARQRYVLFLSLIVKLANKRLNVR